MSTYPHSDAAHPATAIRTASGRLVDLADFRVEDVLLSDIVTSLAHQDRYTGHCPLHPTVAQHSLAVEHIALYLMPDEMDPLVDRADAEQHLSRAALMHDAEEAYTSDLSAPMKRALRQGRHGPVLSRFDIFSERIAGVIERHFECAPIGWESLIHQADVLAWQYESAWAGWSPSAARELPAWLKHDLYIARCYGLTSYASSLVLPSDSPDGGEAAFLCRAAALGMRDGSMQAATGWRDAR